MPSFTRLALVLSLCLLQGCQSPMLVFPGKALRGEAANTTSFEFAREHNLIQLEVNPEAPYSVILRRTLIDGNLYVDAAQKRKWGQLLSGDSRVRVKLGDKVYRARATQVSDPAILARFFSGRTVYRLDPLPPESDRTD